MKWVIYLLIFLFFVPFLIALDATTLKFNYDKNNCINFLGFIKKTNVCLKDTNISISSGEITDCEDVVLRIKINGVDCYQDYSGLKPHSSNYIFSSCIGNLKQIFDSSCKSFPNTNPRPELGDGTDKEWVLSVYGGSPPTVKLAEKEITIISDDNFNRQIIKFRFGSMGTLITLILTLTSILSRRNRTISIILALVSAIINLIIIFFA